MKIDLETDLAIRTLVTMAVKKKRITQDEISKLFGIQIYVLRPAIISLKFSNLIVTILGTGGGLEMTRPSDQITLADVIFGINPKFAFTDSLDNNKLNLLPACFYKKQMRNLSEAMHIELEKTTIRELAELPGVSEAITNGWNEI